MTSSLNGPDAVQQSVNPSFPEFVVALYLVKSKPAEVNIRDHIANLRSYVRSGIRPERNSNGARHLDSVAYTEDSNNRRQHKIHELKGRVFELERELDAARTTVTSLMPEAANGSPARYPVLIGESKKRKRVHTNAAETDPGRRPDNTATASFPANTLDTSRSSTHGEVFSSFTHGGSPDGLATSIPTAIYALQKTLAQNPFAAPTTASVIMFILSTIHKRIIMINLSDRIVSTVAASTAPHAGVPQSSSPITDGGVMFPPSPSPSRRPRDDNNALVQSKANSSPAVIVSTDPGSTNHEGVFDATTGQTIFSLLFNALEKLGHLDCGDAILGQLLYATVKLLKDLLDHICHLATTAPAGNQDLNRELPKRRSTRGKDITEAQALDLTPNEDIIRICGFLIGALQSLKRGRRADDAILDGFMYFLLRRIGEILQAFVFGEEDELSNAVNVRQGQTIRVLSEEDSLRQEKRMCQERQAPYLIWLLERAMACLSIDTGAGSSIQAINQAVTSNPRKIRQGILSEKVKSQLQDTILKEVVGDTLGDFKNSLEAYQDPGIAIESWKAIKQTDVVDFFKAEVWRLIGWDSLKTSIEPDNTKDR